MFKSTITTLLLTFLLSSVHASFYNLAELEELKGKALKGALHRLIKQSHKNRSYKSLYQAYLEGGIDEEYDADHSIVDIYSERPNGVDKYNYNSRRETCGNYRKEGDCFNREHLFPQSAFNKKAPMRNDYFHVFPTDGYINGVRSNYPFGDVKTAEWTSSNGSRVGRGSGYSGMIFEPIDEFKGDVARAMLYFAIRYQDRINSFRHVMLNKGNEAIYKKVFLNTFLKWHKLDPVSEFEKKRNNYGEKYQGNRNPFIDHPEWVEGIWSHL